jgi:hypothetical protein
VGEWCTSARWSERLTWRRDRPSKRATRVRFPSPAPSPGQRQCPSLWACGRQRRATGVQLALTNYVVRYRSRLLDKDAQPVGGLPVPLARGVLIDQRSARIDPWPIRCISSRVEAPAPQRVVAVCRRSWKWKPRGSPARTTVVVQSVLRWTLPHRGGPSPNRPAGRSRRPPRAGGQGGTHRARRGCALGRVRRLGHDSSRRSRGGARVDARFNGRSRPCSPRLSCAG